VSAAARLDGLTLGYAAFASFATLLRGRGDVLGWLLPGYALLAAAALAAPRARASGPAGAFLGTFYPLILAVVLYAAIGALNRSAGVAHDAAVQGWEQALFGAQPSREWIRACPWPWLSWPLHLGYLSYYLILAGAPLGLWLASRGEDAAQTALSMMLAFYACYAVFLLYPVAGPRYLFPMADNGATAVLPATLTRRLLERGSAWGTAFPSSHVAVSLVAAVEAWRRWRLLGAFLMPAAILLAFGTVFGQFHYAVDVLGGALVAVAVLARPR
jgi:membrane-associated phospholipid phosphatase